MPTFAKNTGDLFVELKNERNVEDYRQRNQDEFVVPLHEYLTSLLAEKNLSKPDVIAASQLNREYA